MKYITDYSKVLKHTYLCYLDKSNVTDDQVIYVKTNTLGEKKYLIVNWTREMSRPPKINIYFTDEIKHASVLEQEISQDVYEHFACLDIGGVLKGLEVVPVKEVLKELEV